MLKRPYDLSVPAEELEKANVWWRSLSITDMKRFEQKYFPDFSRPLGHPRAIHQIWEEEGKPDVF